jgi:hypothetical protein
MARNIGPAVTSAATNQMSTAALTHVGTGAARTWPPLPTKVGDYPVVFSLLEIFDSERRCLGSPEPASQEDGYHGIVALAA